MRIKRIEIIGFKSFCDRTVLNFDDPITAVVGPNGCGKSNIVDAIRWCMGEQSAKHLRGAAMGDVIFNGSDNRGPAGMAEVSLTFHEVGFSAETLELEGAEAGDAAELGAAAEREPDGEGESQEAAVAAVPAADAWGLAAAAGPDDGSAARAYDASATPRAVATGASGQGATAAPSGDDDATAAPSGDDDATAAPSGDDDATAAPVTEAQDEAQRVLEDRPPAIDFAQYSEVTITRRLFRDGTSGYFLNKIPCRLRDVTDFFLGTGVGTKAYSIIEQGRIGMIVSARPQDRRSLIEEAAGITKFKTKKRAAERKLDKTRQNLARVNDIVEELSKRLGSLRRQAQKAERYRRYRGELKDIELWIASHRLLDFAVREGVMRRELADAATRRDDARAGFDARDAAIVAERGELAVEERRLASLQEEIFELENRIKLSENKVEFQTREASELERRATDAVAETRSLIERREQTTVELGAARQELVAVDERVNTQRRELDARSEELAAARVRLAEARQALESARAEAGNARTDMARAESQQHALDRRRADARGRQSRLEDEAGEARARLQELERAVKDGERALGRLRQTKLDIETRMQDLESRLASASAETDELEARVETLRTELHRRRSRLQSLREIQEKYEGFARGTRAVMQRREEIGDAERIRGLVADVVQAPERLEIAVEAALGDRLGGVLVDSQEAGIDAIRFLKHSHAGRSAFVPYRGASPRATAHAAGGFGAGADIAAGGIQVEDRTGAPGGEGVLGCLTDLVRCELGYEAVASRLLGDFWVVDALDTALRLHREGCERALVTLDGDIVDGRGIVTGGSRDAEGAGVLAQKREIRELDEIVAELEQDLADATAQFVARKNECQQLGKALAAAKTDTHNRDIDILGHEKDVARSRGELERLRERVVRLDREQAELAESIAEMASEEENLSELLASSRDRNARYEREHLGLTESVARSQAEVEDLSQALTEHKVRAAQLGEQRGSLAASVSRLEQTASELRERFDNLEDSIRSATDRSELLRNEVRALEASLVELREQRRGKAEQLDEGRVGYERRVSDLQVAEAGARKLRLESDELAERASSLEIGLHDLVNERAHMEATIEERYRVTLAREVGDYHLRPRVGDEQRKRLAELKRLIERMGADINLTAIEEYEEVSQRHEYLSAQQIDLSSAVDQLTKAIAKINRTSRKLFRDTFEAINTRFQDLFPTLFRGGKAYLSLTQEDGQDILEAGVEIMARPPGKKNATVDQLSGGEKALTAVALIFAIFLYKPSPFCLLDEVDAPLDDANVDRYNEIVRQMTDRSQFIVITHNKRTMEIADHLYGITMQEPGISKVVSVNLKSVDEIAA